jgi:hypothetical protein
VPNTTRRAGRYGVHAAFFDDEGEIWGCSGEPVRLEVESLEDQRDGLENDDRAPELSL